MLVSLSEVRLVGERQPSAVQRERREGERGTRDMRRREGGEEEEEGSE